MGQSGSCCSTCSEEDKFVESKAALDSIPPYESDVAEISPVLQLNEDRPMATEAKKLNSGDSQSNASTDAGGSSAPSQAGTHSFTFVIKKESLREYLHMDVKHMWGRLVCHKIFEGGEVDRVNKEQLAKIPRGDVLQKGDVIVEVNGYDTERLMIAELQQKLELRIRVNRRC
eukprot:TRINITY_DN104355_c0_g1_i1.p1 TRINITY_DN104355_c0_g1~~TRINITY_DN104355_c0_g1_i1.p1  ORF type:complete len:172 (-),score=36.48 TRINITY_DN104355_c0_g1_i1:196-711(-)